MQSTKTLSTAEVEYMGVTEDFKEAIWLLGLLDDLGIFQEHVSVHCDSVLLNWHITKSTIRE